MTPIGNPARDTHAPPALWEELERRGYLPNQAQCRRCMTELQNVVGQQFEPKFDIISRRLDELAAQRAENAHNIAIMGDKIDRIVNALSAALGMNPDDLKTVTQAAINRAQADSDNERRRKIERWLAVTAASAGISLAFGIFALLFRLFVSHPEIIK